jgi:prevent-host-death family protein
MNIQEAKARLSALVAEAEAGGDVWIARNGRPVVRLTPATTPPIRWDIWPHTWTDAEAAEAAAPLDAQELTLWG